MFEKSSAGNRSSSRDANYQQYRQALRYRFDQCTLGTDRADVTGSPTRLPTTHNQHSRCVKTQSFIYYEQAANGVSFPESFQCGARSITTSESGRTVVSGLASSAQCTSKLDGKPVGPPVRRSSSWMASRSRRRNVAAFAASTRTSVSKAASATFWWTPSGCSSHAG